MPGRKLAQRRGGPRRRCTIRFSTCGRGGTWDLRKGPEETTRREFLEKVLEKLGFAFFSNLDLPEWDRRRTPDYFLFPDEQTKELVFNADLQAKYAAAIALLEAKKVNHPLDAASKKEKRFPHQQVRDYLLAATDEPGRPYFRWGILTNGNLWRLYCREARPDAYFQFHLAGPGASFCTFEEFKTFLALFCPSVFVQTDGACLLDRIRGDAVQFQSELEESIRRRVFTVVEDLANGFWSLSENKLTDADLRDLYDNCLILLYRLLFVLYAEGRGLLPVKLSGAGSNTNYRTKYSLKRLVPRLQNPAEYSSDDFAELQEDLGKLFRLINGDRPATNKACSVPPYNGGLFDSKAHPRLEEWRVGDKSLAGVLRDLIFSSPPGQRSKQREFEWGAIDYADLEVRQLGDIYEGLLGGHLEVVQEAGQSRLRVMGERGALQETERFTLLIGWSDFLVDKTLQPLIDQIEANESVAAAKQAGRKDNSFAREVLKLNIIDPAMGSGHFLVRATEWLADHIVYHPTTEFQIKEVSPGLSQEQAEVSYWRRRVVEACIYGADINRLAVELAKLSLWLTCIASEEPLNFLDHHLRPGNSLMGAKMGELSSLPPERLADVEEQQQTTLSLGPDFAGAVAEAIREIQAIESESSASIEIVKDKERRWNEQVRLRLKPFRDVADLWVASAAGLPRHSVPILPARRIDPVKGSARLGANWRRRLGRRSQILSAFYTKSSRCTGNWSSRTSFARRPGAVARTRDLMRSLETRRTFLLRLRASSGTGRRWSRASVSQMTFTSTLFFRASGSFGRGAVSASSFRIRSSLCRPSFASESCFKTSA